MTPVTQRRWRKIQDYLATRQTTAARIALESFVCLEPGHVDARVLYAGALLADAGCVREAWQQLDAASQWLTDDPDQIAMVALAMFRVGNVNGAHACLRHPAVANASRPRDLMSLAHVSQLMGEHSTALGFMDRARTLGLDDADFHYFRAIQLQFNGRLRDAERELAICLKMDPVYGRAALAKARLRKQNVSENHLAFLRKQLAQVARGTEQHASFEFAFFKELDDLGELDDAWAALERGNAIMHQRLQHDAQHEGIIFDAIRNQFADAVREAEPLKIDGPTPIFVVGMPRSGTTVLERLLGNHSMIASAGELSDFSRQLQWQANHLSSFLIDQAILAQADTLDYAGIGQRYLQQTQWRAQGKQFYVDKLPTNYLLIGCIRRALPQAPILHMVRDPLDVCYSNYKAMFGDAYAYSYDLSALAAHYRGYRQLMDHWHAVTPGGILDVNYADLVQRPQQTLRNIFDFCHVRDEQDCANLNNNRSSAATLSSAQVREPIHHRALGEWRRYARQLAPLQQLLAPALCQSDEAKY